MNKIVLLICVLIFAAAAYILLSNNSAIHTGKDSIEIDFFFDLRVFELNGKNITIFSKPDNYLIEFNRPRIPLYSKEVELPENESLESVDIKDFEMKTYENVEADFVPLDEHFVSENDSVKGFYPEQILQYNVFETLDGKKKIEIIAAPLQYNNRTRQAKIYDKMRIVVYYKN